MWRDERVVAFLTIAPHRPGHTLVVPIDPIDQWTDLDDALWSHLSAVSLKIGRVIASTFDCARVGTVIAGLEVPHCHLHLVPMTEITDLDFARADHGASAASLDEAAERLRAGLRAAGYSEVSDI